MKKIRGASIYNSSIDSTSKIEAGSNIVKTNMGKHSFCGYNCEISQANIGSFVSIANNVVIGGGIHPMEWVSMSPVFYEGKDSVKKKYSIHLRPSPATTTVGHDVWIGEKAIIRQGVKIGIGAVIGMGSIVTKDVEPYAIVAGNPARILRKRFSDEVILALLNSKWWEMSDKELTENAKYFQEPEQFLKNIQK